MLKSIGLKNIKYFNRIKACKFLIIYYCNYSFIYTEKNSKSITVHLLTTKVEGPNQMMIHQKMFST